MLRGVTIAVAAAVALSGCSGMQLSERNALMGSGAGAGAGALVGFAVGGPPTAWLGAAVGGAAGSVIGYLIRPEGCFFQNRSGELWQVPCDRTPVRVAGCYRGNEIGGLYETSCPSDWRWKRPVVSVKG